MTRISLTVALVLTLVAASSATAGPDKQGVKAKYEGKSFTLQHNLHFDDDDHQAEWQNYIDGDFVPLGSKVTVTKIDDTKAIFEGMTRKAVFLAVGYPPYHYTPPFRKDSATNHDPKGDELTYMKGTYDFLKVTFSNDKVVDIED